MGILIETMRREGFELTIGQPQVLVKEIDGKKHEPFENLVVDVPSDYSGKVIDMVTRRKGEMLIMESKGDMQHLEFEIPSRGLIGLRSNMLTKTTGEALMAHRFLEYKPWKGPIPGRSNGVLLSKNQEKTTAYSIDKLQDRGTFFVDPGEEVYVGQIIAEHIKPGDLIVNATEGKQLTNMRASGSDDSVRIIPQEADDPRRMHGIYPAGRVYREVTPKEDTYAEGHFRMRDERKRKPEVDEDGRGSLGERRGPLIVVFL